MAPISDYSYGTLDDSEPCRTSFSDHCHRDDENAFLPTPDTSSLTELDIDGDKTATRVLPLSLLASLAMAITSATTIFAYAELICDDPAHCRESESNAYAAAVATAVCISNICGTLTLGPLERLVKKNQKAGLMIWLLFRASSVAVLAVGGELSSPKRPLDEDIRFSYQRQGR
jgi:hypothetical protein